MYKNLPRILNVLTGSYFRSEKAALLSDILWPVGAPFYRAPVRPNVLNMPKSASANQRLFSYITIFIT